LDKTAGITSVNAVIDDLQLNVFGENTVTRQLYRTQGFAESRVTMIKDVGKPDQ
jgi:hypothetical protein